MRRFLTLAALTVLATPVLSQAAAKPSFAGHWTQIVDPNAPAATGRGRGAAGILGLGPDVTIVQDSTTLTVTRTVPQVGEMKSVYKLSGADSPNSLALGSFNLETVSNAKWADDKLTVSTRLDFNGTPFTTTLTMSLDAGTLVVVSEAPNMQGGAPTVTTTKYKKG